MSNSASTGEINEWAVFFNLMKSGPWKEPKARDNSTFQLSFFLRGGISFPSTRRGVLRRRRDTILTRGRSWHAIHGMQIKHCSFVKRYHEVKWDKIQPFATISPLEQGKCSNIQLENVLGPPQDHPLDPPEPPKSAITLDISNCAPLHNCSSTHLPVMKYAVELPGPEAVENE